MEASPVDPRTLPDKNLQLAKTRHTMYRVVQQVSDLGWVDLYLRSSFGWCAASVATYCQAGWWNSPNPSQPNPGPRPAESPCM